MTKMKEIKQCQSADKENEDDEPYKPQPIKIPAVGGLLAMIYRRFTRTLIGRTLFWETGKVQFGLDVFKRLHLPDELTLYPIVNPEQDDLNDSECINTWKLLKPSNTSLFHFNTISDYVEAFRTGGFTPSDVAKNVIAAIKDSESRTPRMRMIIEFHEEDILTRAAESTERWKANKPLSVFDGIPIAVKDDHFLAGYPCRSGLPLKKYATKKNLSDEGWVVSKLRQGGAVFIGMANAHQLGFGITGINPSKLHGTARCPYNPDYPPGGSSSGTSSAVASGLCPVGLSSDGGGSIRVPASLNSVVGAKVSFGRISGTGTYGHLFLDTIYYSGAICATTRDSAIFYGFVAGKDPDYPLSTTQPQPKLNQFNDTNLAGITVGIDWNFFNDCLPEIRDNCKKAVEYMVKSCGVKVEDISIPEIHTSNTALLVVGAAELYTNTKDVYHSHHDELNTDTELNMALSSSFSASELYMAMKQRTRMMNILKRLFSKVDCIITPTNADFLPKLDADKLKYGLNDMKNLLDMTRYTMYGNLAGNPSISVPVGYSNNAGLPIGILIQTAWWKEDLMFRIAHAMDGYCQLRKPQVFYDLLAKGLA